MKKQLCIALLIVILIGSVARSVYTMRSTRAAAPIETALLAFDPELIEEKTIIPITAQEALALKERLNAARQWRDQTKSSYFQQADLNTVNKVNRFIDDAQKALKSSITMLKKTEPALAEQLQKELDDMLQKEMVKAVPKKETETQQANPCGSIYMVFLQNTVFKFLIKKIILKSKKIQSFIRQSNYGASDQLVTEVNNLLDQANTVAANQQDQKLFGNCVTQILKDMLDTLNEEIKQTQKEWIDEIKKEKERTLLEQRRVIIDRLNQLPSRWLAPITDADFAFFE